MHEDQAATPNPMLRVVTRSQRNADGSVSTQVGVVNGTAANMPAAVAAVQAALSAGLGCRCARSCSDCSATHLPSPQPRPTAAVPGEIPSA